jgi:hypothetical protein
MSSAIWKKCYNKKSGRALYRVGRVGVACPPLRGLHCIPARSGKLYEGITHQRFNGRKPQDFGPCGFLQTTPNGGAQFMAISYPACGTSVNLPRLPRRIASFYRWLCRWHSQTEDLHASTPYYAWKQGVSERTIYRWLHRLYADGYLSSEVDIGVERRLTPLAPPPPPPPKKLSGVCQGKMSGVLPYKRLYAYTTPTQADVVTPPASELSEAVSAVAGEVIAVGVPQPVAVRLVASHGVQAAKNALEAYRKAQRVQNPAGWVIRAIERRYQSVPESVSEGQRRAKPHIVRLPPPPVSVNGLQGKAAFDALRSKLALAGRM